MVGELCRWSSPCPGHYGGGAAAHLCELNAEALIGSQSSRGQVASLNHQRQGECT